MTNAWEYRYSLSLRGVDSSLDNDTDGLSNLGEFQFGSDPTIKSTDADGLSDFWEAQMGYNPRSTDSDGDGIPDDSEDYDGDGLANADELALGSNMLFDQWSAFNPVFGPIGPAVYSYDDANRLTSGAGDYYLDSEGNVKTQP
ncbi:MAG: hypothetical protein JNG86_11820 [Verrucomicrobiaceae bacterium]|nr:hypothetical protein [Verrucomicrobiaceae bacterium]